MNLLKLLRWNLKMSTTGNIDGYIEVILKINDTTGEIEEVATKTVNGELMTLPNWKTRIGGLNK